MCINNESPKLTVELVPKTCWFSNIRSTVTVSEWNKIRFMSYKFADNKCEICQSTGKAQGYKNNVECHEIWDYNDETHIQKLVGLISLCVRCHQVKHIGRAIAMGKVDEVFNHLAKVNKWTAEDIDKHIKESFKLHKERSRHKWELDISLIEKDPYNIVLKPMDERVFKAQKYKKKKKKKNPDGTTKPKSIHPRARLAMVLSSKNNTRIKRPPKKT